MWHTAGTRRTQDHQSQKTTILIFTATEPQVSLVAPMLHADPGVNVKPYRKHCNVSCELHVRQLCHLNIYIYIYIYTHIWWMCHVSYTHYICHVSCTHDSHAMSCTYDSSAMWIRQMCHVGYTYDSHAMRYSLTCAMWVRQLCHVGYKWQLWHLKYRYDSHTMSLPFELDSCAMWVTHMTPVPYELYKLHIFSCRHTSPGLLFASNRHNKYHSFPTHM